MHGTEKQKMFNIKNIQLDLRSVKSQGIAKGNREAQRSMRITWFLISKRQKHASVSSGQCGLAPSIADSPLPSPFSVPWPGPHRAPCQVKAKSHSRYVSATLCRFLFTLHFVSQPYSVVKLVSLDDS